MRLKEKIFKLSIKTRLLIGAVLWILIALIAFFHSETGHRFTGWLGHNADVAFEKTGLYVKQIEVNWLTPIHYTKTEEILKTIQIKRGDKMSTIHLQDLREKLEKLPWIRSVIIERYYPDILKITIEEKMPLALWQNNKKYRPLDDRAEPINTTKQLPADLLLVVGADAPKHLISLIKDLEQVPDIYQYVRAAIRVGERRWNLKLFNAEKGLEILLPEQNVLAALQRLDNHNKTEKLIRRQVAAIDLRTDGKVFLKPIQSTQKKVSKK